MLEAGIGDGDILVVDRSLQPNHGDVVVAQIDHDFTVKTLHRRADQMKRLPAHPTYPEIVPKDGQTVLIVGVVTSVIKQFRKLLSLRGKARLPSSSQKMQDASSPGGAGRNRTLGLEKLMAIEVPTPRCYPRRWSGCFLRKSRKRKSKNTLAHASLFCPSTVRCCEILPSSSPPSRPLY